MSEPASNAALARIAREIAACRACPRLREHCASVAQVKRRAYRDWTYWGLPVPGFGDARAGLYILGLAPGAHGANRTGRMFTGDDSGDWLYAALHANGFANQPTAERRDDGLELKDAFIGAVGRCAPPQNKLVAAEIAACRSFWRRELATFSGVRVIVPLGGVAFGELARWFAELQLLPRVKSKGAFAHGAELVLDPIPTGPPCFTTRTHVVCSYHPSRQNTQTGRLTRSMLNDVFARARALVDA